MVVLNLLCKHNLLRLVDRLSTGCEIPACGVHRYLNKNYEFHIAMALIHHLH